MSCSPCSFHQIFTVIFTCFLRYFQSLTFIIFADIEENGLWDNPTEETESDAGSSDGSINDEPTTQETATRKADASTNLGADSTNENGEEVSLETLHTSSGDGENLNDYENTLSIENEEENEDEFHMTIGDLHRYFPPLDGTYTCILPNTRTAY